MRAFPRPLTVAAALATVGAFVQVPVFADTTAPQVLSVSISPGGPGYTLSGQPTYTAQVPGSTSATFNLTDGQDTIWTGSATTVSNVATVRPPAGLLEPGAQYSIDVVANQGDVVSPEFDSSFQVDTGAAVSAPDSCTSPCTPYTPEQPLADLTFDQAQATDQSLDGLPGDPTEIGTIRLRVTISPNYPPGSSTGSLTGSVRIFDPSASTPVAPTLSHLWNGHDKKAFTTTVDVSVSSVDAVRVLGEGAGPGTVHVAISAIGWLPWETADQAAQDDANDDAPDPSQADIDAAVAGQDPIEGPGATPDPTDEAALEAADPDLATAQSDDADCPPADTGATLCGSSGSTPQTAASTAPFTTLRSALAAPALCSQSAAAPVPTFRYTRFHACRESSIVLTHTVDKEIVGQATIEVTTKFSLATLSQDFTITRQFTLLEATGDLEPGFGMETTFACTRCSQGQIPEKNMYFTLAAPTTTQTWNVSGVAYLAQALTLPAAFTDRWVEAPTALRTTLPRIRCDRLAYLPGAAGGCVVADYTPTLTQSLTGVTSDMRIPTPTIVRHIQRAQAKVPHYGEPVVGIPLTRMHNRLQRMANRRAAVSKCNRMGLAPSCDEYPYASTYQGCALVTFCSVASVPLAENSSQGGDLSRFYGIERLADRDAFTVTVVP